MSKIQVSPFVNFQGRAREAMEFYHKALGGTLDPQSLKLETDGVVIIGSDGHPDYPAKVGDNMGIAVGGTDRDRLTKIFTDLGEGGSIQMPLAAQPWGGEVGWLTDRFGIHWTVNIAKA